MSLLRNGALLLAVLAVCAWIGHRAGNFLLGGLSRAERLSWSIIFGISILVAVILACLAVRMRLGPGPTLAGVALAAVAAYFAERSGVPQRPEPPVPPAARALLTLTALGVAFFAVMALSEPMWSNDFQAIWGLKGKTIALTGSIPARLFHDPMTAWSHPEYPLFLPLTFAALSAALGVWDDHALALLYPVLEVALLAALYGGIKRRHSATAGALAAVLAAFLFSLFRAFSVGMAEIPLAAEVTLFSLAVLDFLEESSGAASFRLAISGFLCAATKQEGALFVLLVAAWSAFFGLRTRRAARIRFLTVTVGPVAVHQILLFALRGAIADRDYDLSFLRPSRWPLLLPRAAAVAEKVLRDEVVPNALPLVALVAFVALARPAGRSRALALLGPPLLAQATIYCCVCTLSSFDPAWQVSFVPRLLRALFPVALLAVAPRLAWVCAPRSDRVAAG